MDLGNSDSEIQDTKKKTKKFSRKDYRYFRLKVCAAKKSMKREKWLMKTVGFKRTANKKTAVCLKYISV